MRYWLSGISLFTLSACSLAPEFKLPEMSIPAVFKEAPKPTDATDIASNPGQWKIGEAAPVPSNGEWWRIFGDDALNKLEIESLKGNQDLQAMAARTAQAKARVGMATAGFFPDIEATGGTTRQQPGSVIPGRTGNGPFKPYTSYTGELGFSYEIDLLGRVLDARNIAVASRESAKASYNAVKLTLTADVAQTYFGLRAADAEAALLAESLKLHEDSLKILRKRLKAGDIGELDIKREEVETEQARTQWLSVSQQRKELEHLLAVLTGRPPADFTFESAIFEGLPPEIPAGLPSSLIERRPDIIAAQHDMAAANANIGLARAAFFPSLNLTGAGGYQSSAFNDLFNWSSRTWSIGPLLTLPIFHGGKATSNLKLSHAMNDEAVAVYRQKVLLAFRDVEDSLSRISSLHEQGKSQDIAAAAAARAATLLKHRYDSGDVSFLEWSDSRRNEIAAKRQQIAIRRDRINATVLLIRALGGNWDTPSAPTAPTPQSPS